MVGGHYTYVEVPLFDWIKDAFNHTRNNYDKLGYFALGFVSAMIAEPAGKGLDTSDHAATLTKGTKDAIHGFECYSLQDKEGNPLPVYSIASGLDYPGVGPQHCYLKDIERVQYVTADDKECMVAFMELSRL